MPLTLLYASSSEISANMDTAWPVRSLGSPVRRMSYRFWTKDPYRHRHHHESPCLVKLSGPGLDWHKSMRQRTIVMCPYYGPTFSEMMRVVGSLDCRIATSFYAGKHEFSWVTMPCRGHESHVYRSFYFFNTRLYGAPRPTSEAAHLTS